MIRTRLAALSAVYLSGLTFASSPRALTAFTDYNGTYADDGNDESAGGPGASTTAVGDNPDGGTPPAEAKKADSPDGGTPQADSTNVLGGNDSGPETGGEAKIVGDPPKDEQQ
ncbi:MAG: hypothetical protein E6R05_06370 [Candidatus Moraniibacteriota bacterium]|nr:MAG: hypothetical protein E6R05_06370 [Candidatus Moranbacteria bacterium]